MNMAENGCEDIHCPKHAGFATHGLKFRAVVVSDKMKRSVVVERPYVLKVPKYERYERKTTRLIAHNPACIKTKVGDRVTVQECRPISKLKAFVIIEKVVK